MPVLTMARHPDALAFQEALAGRIRQQRQERGLSLRGLSRRARVPLSTLQRVEAGRSMPSAYLAVVLADVLRLPLDTLLRG
jgi:transcriptional regulator with XRE-family HTH domain